MGSRVGLSMQVLAVRWKRCFSLLVLLLFVLRLLLLPLRVLQFFVFALALIGVFSCSRYFFFALCMFS